MYSVAIRQASVKGRAMEGHCVLDSELLGMRLSYGVDHGFTKAWRRI